MKKILLLENNASYAKTISQILNNLQELPHLFYADCVSEAYRYAMENLINLFIINISLDKQNPSDASGMAFADRLRTLPAYEYTPIIFISSAEDAKLYAYTHLHCYEYIEKPFDPAHLQTAIEKSLHLPIEKRAKNRFYYKQDGILYVENLDNLVYAKCSQRQVILYGTQKEIRLNYKSIKNLAYELGVDRFLQCNRFTLVNRSYIQGIDSVNRYVILRDNYGKLNLGEKFRKTLIDEFLHGD